MSYRAKNPKFIRAVVLFLTLVFSQSVLAAPAGPLQIIKTGTDKALRILRSTQSGEAPALRQRRGEIMASVDEYFNFEEMAKRALGRPWKDQPPDKRQEFVRLFKLLLFNTYVDKVEGYTGSNEEISYDSEKIDGDYAVVKTQIHGFRNSNVHLDYRLHLVNGEWRVYDVVAEGISFVDNYRSQFASILANGTFDSLLKKMRDKV